jgi:molybdate transport system substrate-binding protein
MRKGLALLRALIGAAVLAVVGCGGESGTAATAPAGGGGLEVLCGGSFQEPVTELAKLFEEETGTRVVLSFGQSEDLLPHVKLHERGDIFVTHDPYVEYTKEAGALLRSVAVGTLAPVLVVAKGNPKGIARLEDLARPGVSVCLLNPEFSTCGEMVFALLEKKGIKDAVLANVGNALFRAHAEVASAVLLGHRDAGVMWNGVAHNWLDKLDVVPTPYEYDREIRVAVIGLSYSKQTELVTRFLDFSDRRGESVFREYGYAR